MPARPWVMPSHMAGTPPANWATPPASLTACLSSARVALERLVGREHVVVGRDDARCCGARRRCRWSFSSAPQAAKPWARFAQPRCAAGGSFGGGVARSAASTRRGCPALRAAMRAVTSVMTGCTARDATAASACAQALAGCHTSMRCAFHEALADRHVVTMADVARLAGVSVTTVSHVINGTRPASERDPRARAGGDRAHRLPAEHVARALARAAARSRSGWRSAGSRTRTSWTCRRRRGGGGRARATRCCSATRATTRSTSCGSCARWPSAGRRAAAGAVASGALEHALPYLESAEARRSCCSTASSTAAGSTRSAARTRQPTARARRASRRPTGTGGSGWSSASPGSPPPTSACAAIARR